MHGCPRWSRRRRPAATDRQMQDVGPQAVAVEVAEGGALGSSRRVLSRMSMSAIRKGHPAGALPDQRQDDEAAVVVREPLAGWEPLRMPIQDGEVVRGRRQPVHRDGQHVVGHRLDDVLVEVVDARRWASRCSTVTSSWISGRSSPSTERAVVSRSSRPSSMRLMMLRAVSAFVPLARPNLVSTALAMPLPRAPNRMPWRAPPGRPRREPRRRTCRGSDTVDRALEVLHLPTVAASRAFEPWMLSGACRHASPSRDACSPSRRGPVGRRRPRRCLAVARPRRGDGHPVLVLRDS